MVVPSQEQIIRRQLKIPSHSQRYVRSSEEMESRSFVLPESEKTIEESVNEAVSIMYTDRRGPIQFYKVCFDRFGSTSRDSSPLVAFVWDRSKLFSLLERTSSSLSFEIPC